MSNWQFCIIGVLGLGILGMFTWFVFVRKEKFDAPFLGLLTLGTLLILVSLVQPRSIKYAGFELNDIKKDAEEAATRIALETTAMLVWNAGHWDEAGRHNEELATNLLKELYGDKALEYRYALQKKGIYLTPKAELEKIPETQVPKEVQSPLYEKFLKNFRRDNG